jgi:hypothetical protein
MKHLSLLAIIVALACSCNQNKQEEQQQTQSAANIAPTLTKVWETDTIMTTAESALYDKNSGRIYVSNINGDHSTKDGNGFISVLTKDGKVQTLQWAKGLDAPKGMALVNNTLYVTDIDQLVAINIADSSISKRYPVQGAAFLNDAATDGTRVFFTDTGANKLHVLENDSVRTLGNFESINGVEVRNNKLYVLDKAGFHQLTIEGLTPTTINKTVTGGDGLVALDDSTYIASRWHGEIFLVMNGEAYKMLDTQTEKSNTADIGYIAEDSLVLVPTFLKNKVAAYRLSIQ